MVDLVTPPYGSPDKLMKHSLFEPPIVPEFPCQCCSHGGRSCHTPYGSPDKLMNYSVFELPIVPEFPCQCCSHGGRSCHTPLWQSRHIKET